MNVLLIAWKRAQPAANALWQLARSAWPTVAVVISAIVVTSLLWRDYVPQSRQLWTDVVHDRNAHLEAGLGLASDLIHGRIGEVVRDIDRLRTWPPLHDGVLVAGSLMLSGMDVRYAVWPSLIGFAGTIILAFLLTRMLVNGDGTLAGSFAAMLVLVSPAQRAFATDVMLESLGACLTLAALYGAVKVKQVDSPDHWRWLAIALSGLFFLKYNYWFLVVIALVLAHLGWILRFVPVVVKQWLPREAKKPLNWLIALLALVCLWVKWGHAEEFTVFGRTILIRSTMGLATAAYWLLLIRIAPSCWRFCRQPSNERWRAIVNWHLIPAALWLAWPQKLACFLWVLNPSDNVGEFPANDRFGGFSFYANAVANDYHVWVLSAAVVGLFAVIGIVAALNKQLRPGGILVVIFVLLAVGLTAMHPNRKSRFLHSWLPAVWVLAGAGLDVVARKQMAWRSLVGLPPSPCPLSPQSRGERGKKRICLGLGHSVLASAFVVVHLPALGTMPHAPEGGIQSQRTSALNIGDEYLNQLSECKRPAIFSNVPIKFLARWTYMDKFGRGVRPVTEIPGFDGTRYCSENVEAVINWLKTTNCDAIVWIEISPTSLWFVPVPGCAGLSQLQHILETQSDRTLIRCSFK